MLTRWQNTLRLAVAERLERGAGPRWPQLKLDPRRRLTLPEHVAVVGVGGALLGGSGRTALAIAIAEHLARATSQVALLSHGYGGALQRPTLVTSAHHAREVGDEAVLAYRRLQPLGARVWSAPRGTSGRQATLDAAVAAGATRLVIDGVLQTTPQRLSLSLLALSGERPWGSEQLWPRGDLRTPPERAVAAADWVVHLHDQQPEFTSAENAGANVLWAKTSLELSEPPPPRWVLLLGEARAERVVQSLARHNLHPTQILRAPDHRAHSLDLRPHLATGVPLCMSEKTRAGVVLPAHTPVLLLCQRVELPPPLKGALTQLG